MMSQTRHINPEHTRISRFTGRNCRTIAADGSQKTTGLVLLDAAQMHETELFCRMNEELRQSNAGEIILVSNCPEHLAQDICKWSGHRQTYVHYCKKNKAVAISR